MWGLPFGRWVALPFPFVFLLLGGERVLARPVLFSVVVRLEWRFARGPGIWCGDGVSTAGYPRSRALGTGQIAAWLLPVQGSRTSFGAILGCAVFWATLVDLRWRVLAPQTEGFWPHYLVRPMVSTPLDGAPIPLLHIDGVALFFLIFPHHSDVVVLFHS